MNKETIIEGLVEDGFTLDKFIIVVMDDMEYRVWEKEKAPKEIAYFDAEIKRLKEKLANYETLNK